MWMCPSAVHDSPAAEISAEKCIGYTMVRTLKKPGEDTTELYNTSLWSSPYFIVSYQRIFGKGTGASFYICLELMQ